MENTTDPRTEARRTSLTPKLISVLLNISSENASAGNILPEATHQIQRTKQEKGIMGWSKVKTKDTQKKRDNNGFSTRIGQCWNSDVEFPPHFITGSVDFGAILYKIHEDGGRYDPVIPSILPVAPIKWCPSSNIIHHPSQQSYLPPASGGWGTVVWGHFKSTFHISWDARQVFLGQFNLPAVLNSCIFPRIHREGRQPEEVIYLREGEPRTHVTITQRTEQLFLLHSRPYVRYLTSSNFLLWVSLRKNIYFLATPSLTSNPTLPLQTILLRKGEIFSLQKCKSQISNKLTTHRSH